MMIAVVFMALMVVVRPVHAHANLLRAVPAPGSTADASPRVVYAEFTEELDHSFSRIEVFNASGESITNGPTEPDPTNAAAMLVPIRPLSDGSYVAVWRSLSVVDGHIIRGSFAFGVGEPVDPGMAVALATVESSPLASISRGLLFISIALIVGAPVHTLLQRRRSTVDCHDHLERRVVLLLLGAGLLALLGQVSLLGIQVVALGEDSLMAGFSDVFGAGQWGILWIARTVALIVVLVLADRVSSPSVGPQRRSIELACISIAGSAMAVTISLGSHAAALADFGPALVVDTLLILAVGVWVGGFPVLLLALLHAIQRSNSGIGWADVFEVVARFSALATVAVGLIVVTGAYSAWLQVLELSRLWTTEYGILLLIKLTLVGPLLALGALNRFWAAPRLRIRGSTIIRTAKMVRLLVAAELMLAIAVLMVVGFLTEREPARQVTEQSRGFVAAEAASSGTIVRLLVLPGRPGPNTLEIEVIRERESLSPEATLEIEFKYLDVDLGTVVAWPQRDVGSRFRLETENLNLAGKWQLLAVVRSPGSFDARVPIRLDIGGLDASTSFVEIDRTTAARLWALTIVGIGLVLAFATLSRAGWSPVIRRFGVSTGFGAMVLGGALFLAGQDSMVEVPSVNQVLPDAVSVGAGRTSYMTLCAGCHGLDGRGDGPIAATLDPKPVDLRIHVPLHRDADLFRFIKDGIQGTGMKGFGDQLDQIDIWHVINFLQTLPESGQS